MPSKKRKFEDNFSNFITNDSIFIISKYLRILLIVKGYNDLPKSAVNCNEYNIKSRSFVIKEIETFNHSRKKFKLTLDE